MINVLDQGYVRLKDYMGTDLTPVNSAKVSFNKESAGMGEKEAKLINFLAGEDHSSPFRHAILSFEVFAPLMVCRQWWKYVIGSDHEEIPSTSYREPFTSTWNESSRRYITEEPVFYLVQPSEWRSAPDNKKQGSGEPLPIEVGTAITNALVDTYTRGLHHYEWAMKKGVCAEQARLFLPAYGLYVRWIWTASLQGVSHFLNQRLTHDAQKEIQLFARAVYDLSKEKFPVALEALLK